MMYYRGHGVAKDPATARALLQKAAARGYAPAQETLARLDAADDSESVNGISDANFSARPVRSQ